jgi:hypothetical protein
MLNKHFEVVVASRRPTCSHKTKQNKTNTNTKTKNKDAGTSLQSGSDGTVGGRPCKGVGILFDGTWPSGRSGDGWMGRPSNDGPSCNLLLLLPVPTDQRLPAGRYVGGSGDDGILPVAPIRSREYGRLHYQMRSVGRIPWRTHPVPRARKDRRITKSRRPYDWNIRTRHVNVYTTTLLVLVSLVLLLFWRIQRIRIRIWIWIDWIPFFVVLSIY